MYTTHLLFMLLVERRTQKAALRNTRFRTAVLMKRSDLRKRNIASF